MKELIAQSLANDPRIAEAKRLLLDAVAEHACRLRGVTAPDPDTAAQFRQTLERFGEIRGGSLYYPYLGSGIGRGPLVELVDGSVKYDMISGIGVHYLGHSHPALIAASVDDLPEPVGPVTNTMPLRSPTIFANSAGRLSVSKSGIFPGITRITTAQEPRCMKTLTRKR